jgi:hypothetical protein
METHSKHQDLFFFLCALKPFSVSSVVHQFF